MINDLEIGIMDNFRDKTVLITGHTGFKGSWLSAWLKLLGAKVIGIGLDPVTQPSHFIASNIGLEIMDLRIDIRNRLEIEDAIVSYKPDFVFHLAAQALVQDSYKDPITTWETNVIGTLNVLEGLRKLDKQCAAVIITSDKCYKNYELSRGYSEVDELGGSDPYSASKGAAELAIQSHIKSFFPLESSKIRISSARAGNVIGGGDWAKDRIIPDCVKSWEQGNSVKLRNPQATRPWQHVLEPLSGYLTLAIALTKKNELHGEAFNFGPSQEQDKSVLDLVNEMSKHWEKVKWNIAEIEFGDKFEAGLLKLDSTKSKKILGWEATMSFYQTIKMTSEWYQNYYAKPSNADVRTNLQIQEYVELSQAKGLKWANPSLMK
jgi:CDP-glucose 4,6-dehydratase